MIGRSKRLGTCLALLMLLSSGVIFLKFSFTNVINLVFIGLYLFLFAEYKFRSGAATLTYNHSNGKVILLLLMATTTYLWLLFPFRGLDDRLTFDIIWYVVLITCLFLDKPVMDRGILVFANIMFWITILAIANYVLSVIGVDLPYIEFNVATRETTYYLYPGTVRLYGQDYELFGRTGFRMAGVFSEPSMFGVLCGLVLYSGAFRARLFRRVIIAVGLILSFSSGAILMSLGYILFAIKRTSVRVASLIGIGVVIMLGAIYLPQEVIDRFFLDKFSGDVIGNRISGEFDTYYGRFLTYDDTQSLLLGKGADILSNNDFVASDYRGFILKYGLLGVMFLFLLVISFVFNDGKRVDKFQVLFVFGVIFAHRSWLTLFFVFLFFLYYLSVKDRKMSIS